MMTLTSSSSLILLIVVAALSASIALASHELNEVYDFDPNDEPDPNYNICNDAKYKKNRIIQENYCTKDTVESFVANSSVWDVNGFGDPKIQGFATDISYGAGDVARFKIDATDAASYRVDIFRMGHYRGNGARKLATLKPLVELPFKQPDCVTDPHTLEYSCTAWAVTAEWSIPKGALSGVYIARPTRTDGAKPKTWRADNAQQGGDVLFDIAGHAGEQPMPGPHKYGANGGGELRNQLIDPQASHIYFVVRNDDSRAGIVMQTADTVWQAYNTYGGTSLYGSFKPEDPKRRCYVASMDRPLRTRELRSVNAFLGSEFPMVQFLERHGYDVTYITGVDTDRIGKTRLPQHKIFFSVGHDEYWSGQQRKNVEHARDEAGVHLAFFSGNDMFWRIRWEDNANGDKYRKMVVYKETQHPEKLDPNLEEWTGTFRDARPFNPLGANPENAVLGQIFTMNAWRNDPLLVPRRFSTFRYWRNTDVEKMNGFLNGKRLSNNSDEIRRLTNWRRTKHVAYLRGMLGHELDEDVDNGFRPPAVIHLSETQIDNVMYSQDYGATYDSGSAVHRLTLYKSVKSGAKVFGAGTVQWGWALAGFHDSETGLPPIRMNNYNVRVGTDVLAPVRDVVQFTVTLLNEMAGVTPVPETLRGMGGVRVLNDLPVDDEAPLCRVESIQLFSAEDTSGKKGRRIFPDTPDGQPEDGIVVRVRARDVGPGVVAGVEVLLDRWYFALPVRDSSDGPAVTGIVDANELQSDDTKRNAMFKGEVWKVVAPIRGEAKTMLDQGRLLELLNVVACRATDDSLNTGAPHRLDDERKAARAADEEPMRSRGKNNNENKIGNTDEETGEKEGDL